MLGIRYRKRASSATKDQKTSRAELGLGKDGVWEYRMFLATVPFNVAPGKGGPPRFVIYPQSDGRRQRYAPDVNWRLVRPVLNCCFELTLFQVLEMGRREVLGALYA